MVTMATRMAQDIKIVLNAADKRYLTVAAPTVDQRIDALKGGQMTVQFSRLTQRPMDDVPKMRIIHVEGTINP
jgi:hypothetical protein